jgi:hypothetical protein
MKTHKNHKNLATILLQNLTVSGDFSVRQLTAKTRTPSARQFKKAFLRLRGACERSESNSERSQCR